jgi:hypothetical protein
MRPLMRIISTAVVVILAFNSKGAFLGQSQAEAEVCQNFPQKLEAWKSRKSNLPTAAHMTESCALAFQTSVGADAKDLLVQSGFPSALYGVVGDQDLIELIDSIVEAGDQGYFGKDSGIIEVIDKLSSAGKIGREQSSLYKNFVAMSKVDRFNSAEIPSLNSEALDFIPIWRENTERQLFAAACKASSCVLPDAGFNLFESDNYLAIKYRLATSYETTTEQIKACQIDLPQFLALRRYGIIDASCSMPMHLNGMAEFKTALSISCAERFQKFHLLSYPSDNDIVRYFQFVSDPNNSSVMDLDDFRENAQAISRHSPELAQEILKLKLN